MLIDMTDPGGQFVQSLARGLEVITAYDDDHVAMTLSEVAGRTGLSRATARRFLLTLTTLGYMRNDGKYFSLTPQVLRLGTAYLSGLGLPQIAQPHLESLSEKVGESTSVAVLDGSDIVYVARVSTRRIMTVGITVGTRFPAFATSMGRVLLAGLRDVTLDAYFRSTDLRALTEMTQHDEASLRSELARTRAAGFAVVDQELEPGLMSVAAPIVGPDNDVVAAVNISTLVGRGTTAQMPPSHIANLRSTADAISIDLARLSTSAAGGSA